MVKSIEEYVSETTKSYQPATDALNKQLSGLSGITEASIKDIENQYANQRAQLLNSANQAAEAASLSAAGNGGSFGGAANEANRKYYERSFMPAMTSSNTNRNTSISQARANEAQQRSNLEQQLANLYSQANAYGMQRYDDALKQEEAIRQFNEQLALQQAQLELQKKQQEEAIRQYNLNLELEKQKLAESKRQASIAAQSASSRALGYLPGQQTYKTWDFGNGYSIINNNGNAVYVKNGQQISAGDFLLGAINQGGHHQYDKWNDIWNNGVSTSGVGADTIEAAYGGKIVAPLQGGSKNYAYGYLF